ncbi:MAG: YceI family protein [Thermogemmatispora sp.]|uniref:YceI family protein n=1 Tax=Thermogemmatispora sp. TaxID=1968838 RepID=UPI002631403F|nr:YceI family protein [Thermogemmatispora sp.]MBX5456154.1 YceI family protein [Thermogemmatispora sp.]
MKRKSIIVAVVLVVVVVAVLVGSFLVYAQHFASSVNQPHQAAGPISVTGTPTTIPGLRTFQIVPDQTTASYSVYENLIIENKPHNKVIGTTHAVQGSFGVRTDPTPLIGNMKITVDLRTLQTDSPRRDNYVQRNALQTDQYPYATFVSVLAQGLPANYSDGQNVHFKLIGNLTMHGQTNRTEFDVQGKLSGDTITGTATTTIYMTDFGIQPPNLANIAISENQVTISITFTARAAGS